MRFNVGTTAVDLADEGDRVCIGAATRKAFEPASLAAWARLCRPGATVLDVGAYTGLYAISAARLGCDVVAFEPLPQNAERMIRNAQANGVRGKIRLVEAAVSDFVGEAELRFNAGVPFTSGASLVPVKTNYAAIKVPIVTIDMFAIEDVAAMKIDVERNEPAVLRGAAETLARCRPALIIEVLGDAEGAAIKATVPGYRVAEVLDGRNWLMVPAC